MSTRRLAAAAVASLICLGADAGLAATEAQKCEAAVEKAAAKYAKCRLNAEWKFTKTGDVAKLQEALAQKCLPKFKFIKAFYEDEPHCPTVEPQVLQGYLEECTNEVAAIAAGGRFPICGDGAVNAGEQCDAANLAGESCSGLGLPSGTLGCTPSCTFDTSGCAGACAPPSLPATGQTTCLNSAGAVIPCAGTGHDGDVQAGTPVAYVDNGDGTLTDVSTGLMWEKLSDDGTIHDVGDAYIWEEAFTAKVAALNAGSFAGYTDWRLPNIRELQSLRYYGGVAHVNPAFNTGCTPGCTVLTCSCNSNYYYWSSTTYHELPRQAWTLEFTTGENEALPKRTGAGGFAQLLKVRAVRGGA